MAKKTSIKKTIVFLFGYSFMFWLVDLKRQHFPNQIQRELKKKEDYNLAKRTEFYSSFIKQNFLCFDVGANIGNRVTPLLKIGARVVAVEPQEICYKYLRYKFRKKIEIVTKGLCEKESVREFHISNYSAISSFSNEWINAVKDDRFKENNWNKTVIVKMTTLDRLIEKFGLPEFIKIDVEGYETEVLKGLSTPVNMISFEYTVPEHTFKAVECINLLEKINSDIECNYCIGESMAFVLKDWVSAIEMKKRIASTEFTVSGFGDIYVRNNLIC